MRSEKASARYPLRDPVRQEQRVAMRPTAGLFNVGGQIVIDGLRPTLTSHNGPHCGLSIAFTNNGARCWTQEPIHDGPNDDSGGKSAGRNAYATSRLA